MLLWKVSEPPVVTIANSGFIHWTSRQDKVCFVDMWKILPAKTCACDMSKGVLQLLCMWQHLEVVHVIWNNNYEQGYILQSSYSKIILSN